MQTPINSVPALTDDDSPAAKLKAWIARLEKLLDPDYPSAIVESPQPMPDGLMGKRKPQMVEDDDRGWVVEI